MPRTKRGAAKPLKPITLKYEVTLTFDRDTTKLRLIKDHIESLLMNGRDDVNLCLGMITNSIQRVKAKRILEGN